MQGLHHGAAHGQGRLQIQATTKEEQAFAILADLILKADQTVRKSARLFRIVLEKKALFASPADCLETLTRRIQRQRRQGEDSDRKLRLFFGTAFAFHVEIVGSHAVFRPRQSSVCAAAFLGKDDATCLIQIQNLNMGQDFCKAYSFASGILGTEHPLIQLRQGNDA